MVHKEQHRKKKKKEGEERREEKKVSRKPSVLDPDLHLSLGPSFGIGPGRLDGGLPVIIVQDRYH